MFTTPNSNYLLTEQYLSTYRVSYQILGMGVGCSWVNPSIPHSLPPSLCILIPQVWAEELFKLAMNILAQNASRNTFLRKA